MTANEPASSPTVLSLQIPAPPENYDKPIHHAYIHPDTMSRFHLWCNQAASLTTPPKSSTAPSLPCLVHVWPDTTIPLDTIQLHPAAATTFSFTYLSAIQLTAVVSDVSVTSLPPAVELNILRWLQPVTTHTTLPPAVSTPAANQPSTDAAVEASISRQLWGRTLLAGSFTVVSILSNPLLIHTTSLTHTAALITPHTVIHCTVTATSPPSLLSPHSASVSDSASPDWYNHVTATYPTECTALTQFLSLHTHSFTPTTASPTLLLCGSSGSGRSTLLSLIGTPALGGSWLTVQRLTCGELIASCGATSNDTSTLLSDAWQQCTTVTGQRRAAVLVIDDITPLLTTSNFPSLSSQLLTLLDSSTSHHHPLLIASCDDSQPISPHWLRAGRFDEQLRMRGLSGEQRQRVLEWHVSSSGLVTSGVVLQRVASRLHGCSVKQLMSMWRYATLLWAEERLERESEKQSELESEAVKEVTWQQWETAIQAVAPPTTSSSLLAPTTTTSSAALQPTAADPFPLVGGYTPLKKHLLLLIHSFLHTSSPSQQPTLSTFARPTGILLHGDSGCGKSLLLSSLAALSASPGALLSAGGVSFGVVWLHVASVLSPYLGESERQLRSVFEQAKTQSPCLLLIDNIDALIGSRGGDDSTSDEGGATTRLLTTLLVLLDGIDSSHHNTQRVLPIATTQHPSALDSALLRPGRLSSQLLVGLPSADDRRGIVECAGRVGGVVWGGSVEWGEVMRRTRGCSGAELDGLVRDSVWLAWRESESEEEERPSGGAVQRSKHCVEMRHLQRAMNAMGCFD